MNIYDFPNLLAIIIVILVSLRLGLIPIWVSFFLGLSAFIPFFLNDVLFPASLMSDQFAYLEATQYVRSLDFNSYFPPSIEITGRVFAFFPLPYVESIQSLGFFNRLLATIIVIWLYSYKNVRGWPLLFIIFYPSFLLYSSLALRDTIILFLMMISVILFLEKRRFVALLISMPLFYLKFQNFFLLIVFYVIHLSFSRDSIFFKFKYIFLAIITSIMIPFIMPIIELIDFYRYAFHIDDGGDPSLYIPMLTFSDFFTTALTSAPYFLMKPFPWESTNFLQLVQSFENILVAAFLVFFFLKAMRIDKSIAFKWGIFLIASFSIYGLVVYNFGTAARYKFPFLFIAVVGLAYEIYLKHGRLILNRRIHN